MASSRTALALMLLAPAAASTLRGTGGARSVAELITKAHIQPEAVSHLLGEVERQWDAEALSVLQGKGDAASSLSAMVESCDKVSKAIVGGSEGNKDKVVEYLKEVCSADAEGQDKDMCHQYATAFETHLSDDLNANREDLNIGVFCQTLYKGPVMEAAKKQQEKLAADVKVEEKKAQAVSAEEKEAAGRKTRTEAYIKQKEDTVKARELGKAAHEHLQQVKDIMARATQNLAAVAKETDSAIGDHVETEEIVERARKAAKIADEKTAQAAEEKEAEEAEAKAKAARARLDELRARKAATQKAAEEKAAEEAKAAAEKKAEVQKAAEKAEPTKVALVARKAKMA